MRKLDRYLQPPGSCYVCRAAKREGEDWILDLDRDITDGMIFEGRLYLCQTCSFEIAHLAGCATPAMLDRFVGERDAAIRQATSLMDENEQLRRANAALAAITSVEPVELAATPRYACAICIAEGVPSGEAGKNNPQGLARHLQSKHGMTYNQYVHRGDAALEETSQ